MTRALYIAGWSYVAVCGLLLARPRSAQVEPTRPSHVTAPTFRGDAAGWFAQMKPFCNAVEVEVQQQANPAPSGTDGAGYSAACFALAGKIDRARSTIERLDGSDRPAAAGIVFEIGHPVADAGDDQSAGPIMRLVVEYQPQNYMALYHAGISESILGHSDIARTHLERFLQLYKVEDYYRSNAITVLNRLNGKP